MRRLVLISSLLLVLSLAPGVLEAKGGGRISGKVAAKSGEGLIGAVITLFREDGEGGTLSFTRSDRRGAYRGTRQTAEVRKIGS